jgi:hypothetical protein
VSTAGDTSAAEGASPPRRALQRFGRIVVVGGGCYGGYYVRQLGRAERAGAVEWEELLVVDRDGGCAVAALPIAQRPPRMRLRVSTWEDHFAADLAAAADDPARMHDAIVPSPLMPHLMADWLVARARARWPDRAVAVEPLIGSPPVPWQRVGEDGTHYVSFAEWMCPINCIEPARCPETRGPRTWSMPIMLEAYTTTARADGRRRETPLVFHCTHRAFGVGMIDVRDILTADATMATEGAARDASFLIGTVSHCHGALRRVTIGAPSRERPGSIADFSR